MITDAFLPNGRLMDPSRIPTPPTENAPHAIVIGAGFGGLAAAIRLGVRGYRVTVVDRLEQAGGRARVFRQDGYTFDAGPTLITAPWLFEELWQLCGKRMADYVDVRPVTPFYKIRFPDGHTFHYTGDAESMREEVRKLNPADVDGYERFVAKSRKIFDVGFDRLAHVPFGSPMDMLRVAPSMIKLESYLTVAQLVGKYVKDERLRQVLSFHPLLVGGNPYATTSIYTLIAFLERKWGVWFPMGGTGAMVQGMVDLMDDLHGELRLGAEVQEIVIENGAARGVRLADGETLRADLVVSNADSAWTYKHLVPARHRTSWTDKKIDRSDSSMGLFVWYFGTDRKYEDVAHHTILLGPRYKGLLTDIFEKKILAEDHSLYLHRPTATDPALAPEGCDGFYVLSPVPHLGGSTDWKTEAEVYRKKVERTLSGSVLPGLEHHITTSRMLTPREFETDYLAFRGAAFGIQPKLSQSAFFRPHNQSEDIEDLYLVGAGTHPGAGMPGVLSTARVLDTVVPDVR